MPWPHASRPGRRAFNGFNLHEWSHAVIQIDVWARDEAERNSITAQIRKILLKALGDLGDIGASLSGSTIVALNEKNRMIFLIDRKSVV